MYKEKAKNRAKTSKMPTPAQTRYLSLGVTQPGGKLPLFDREGQRIKARTIRACIAAGWCREWYQNPVRKDWLVCKLTTYGRNAVSKKETP